MQPAWLTSAALALAAPAVAASRAAIDDAADRLAAAADVPWTEDVSAILVQPLEQDVLALCERTIVLELHVARMLGTTGEDDARDVTAAFAAQLGTASGRDALLGEYQVLARLLQARAAGWAHSAIELLERLARDAPQLTNLVERPGKLGELQAAVRLGDSHEGARAVLGLRFSLGGRLIYKPRDLAAEEGVAGLIDWCERAGAGPLPRVPQLLSRQGYGWMAMARPHACSSADDVGEFYEALGAVLAILHALAAVDVHYENLVACGNRPTLVDLECLFHPRVGGANADAVDPLGGDRSARSVLRVGLLPAVDVAHGIDLSGMAGGADGQTVEVDEWDEIEGDAPLLVRRQRAAAGNSHLPTLQGQVSDATEHVPEIDRGFVTTYRLLQEHRSELLRDDGPVGSLATVPIRVLLRHSGRYNGVLFAAVHPNALRDDSSHRAILARVRRGLDLRPDLARVVEAELHDLGLGDFPRFTSRPGSRAVRHHACGPIREVLGEGHGFSPESALARLGDRDLACQRAIIARALTRRGP